MRHQVHALLQSTLLFLLASGMFVLPPNLVGQEARPRIVVSSKKPIVPVNLRPNSMTTLGLNLENPTEEGLRNVTVTLVQIVEDQPRVIAQTEVEKLAARDFARLVFKKPKEGPEKMDLVGQAPFKIQIWVDAKQPKDFVPIKKDLDLTIFEPRGYVTSLGHFDKIKNRLSFKVSLDEDGLTDTQPCTAQLVLGPELVPTKKGAYQQQLTKAKQPVDLYAENVHFTGPKVREGRVYVTVDGYERAFTYPVTLTGSGDLDEVAFGKKIGAHIRVPRFAKPDAKFKVPLELDGPLDPGYRVEIGLDRAGMKEQFQVVKFNGLREQKIALSFSPGGDLICKTEVHDWQAEFDTTDVFGDIWLRLSVFKKDSKSGKDEEMELIVAEEHRPHLAAMEADGESKRLFARVTQDVSPPEGVMFLDPSEKGVLGKPMTLKVKVNKREPHQAPIGKFVFLRGKPAPPDGKITPDQILGEGEFDPKTDVATFMLPAQEKSELELSVLVITGSGESAVKTRTIGFKEAAKGLAKIKGQVAHGELLQQGVPVTLADDKGKVLDTQKTNEEGEYVFDSVAPGKYVVTALRTTPALVGAINVVVPEGKELIENQNVRLLAK